MRLEGRTETWAGPAGRRPRLLFLAHTLPYPPDGGVWIRTYHVLRILAQTFDVTALCFERLGPRGGESHDTAAAVRHLARFGRAEAFPVPQRHSRLRFVWDHLRSVTRRRVYTWYLFDSAPYRQRLQALMGSEPYDLVHLDSVDLARYLEDVSVPAVCVHHNVESVLLARRSSAERSRVRRAYLAYQARRMAELERWACRRAALNVVVSDRDGETLAARAPGARFLTVPNGVDTEFFRPAAEGAEAGILLLGGVEWFPNRDGLAYFCERVLPLVRSASEASVRCVGRARAEDREYFRRRYGVELTGYVPDVRPYLRDAACVVVPLRVGGGTRLKILDAWAMGKAVVSTSVGCEGLEVRPGENILVADTPEAFADAVLSLLRDRELRRRLGRGGRATVEARYAWDAVGRAMTEAYVGLLAAGRAATR
jgi:glycosyltransferase involved in cell wall biosynthesis